MAACRNGVVGMAVQKGVSEWRRVGMAACRNGGNLPAGTALTGGDGSGTQCRGALALG